MPKKTFLVAIITSTIILPGCLGELIAITCDFIPDSDHCYQSAAVQSADPTGCDKISGEGFEGSNPPRDKCYMQIAANTGDLDICKRMQGGFMSYTPEECFYETAVNNENPSGCNLLSGAQKADCLRKVSPNLTAEKVVDIDEQIEILKEELAQNPDPDLENQLKGLETKKSDILDAMTEDNRKQYERVSDPGNKMVLKDYAVGDIDMETKEQLIDLNEKLKQAGTTMTKEQYESIRDYYKFINDPKNDIEKMDEKELLKDRWNEKLGNTLDTLKFWKSNSTKEEAKLDEQLRFYERMLERQIAIDNQMTEIQQDTERDIDIVSKGVGKYAEDKIKDFVIKEVFGKAVSKANSATTAILGEALDNVKAEAKAKEFRGIVRAYNLGMEEELKKAGGNIEKAHATVMKKMQENPYEYEDQNTFAKYGNLLENGDCNGKNPHCLDKEVFWKAMKKSYTYQSTK
ncbi:MAG: hypothetical protein PHP74_01820 [Candidatus Gracilibacteria bacterium]|nr:hypothetical protein [Candidatus Gracilibacteria bacterium]